MSSENPLVSVHMITYNHEKFIAQAIEGVLMQRTNFPFELIIGEDCSTDRTREIVVDYANRHPDIVRPILHDNNVGMMRNMKICLQACSGKYTAICEGDDYWIDPLKLQKQVDFLENNPSYTLCVHATKIMFNNRHVGEVRPYSSDTTASVNDIIIKGGLFATNSLLFKKHFLSNPPNFLSLPYTGASMLIMFLAAEGHVFYIDEFMSVYRKNVPGSWTKRFKKSTTENKLKHYDYHIKAIEEFDEYYSYKFNEVIEKRKLWFEFQKNIILNNHKELRSDRFRCLFKRMNWKLRTKLCLKRVLSVFR